MNKQDFLKKLEHALRKLKKEERKKYIEYYEEIISDIIDSGVSEAEAIERQGSVEQIAEDILANIGTAGLKRRDIKGTILVIASVILLLCCSVPALLKAQFQLQMSTSVGIIGGADGPTSIFVAGKIGSPWGLYIATAVTLLITVLHFVRKHVGISKKVVIGAVIAVVAVIAGVLLFKLWGKQNTLSTPLGHTFSVEEVLYSRAEEDVLNFVPTEGTVPMYSFSNEGMMKNTIVSVAGYGDWRTVGILEETELSEENFDVYFEEDSLVSKLRKKNKHAWLSQKENECYYLLQQKNGEIYLVYWNDFFEVQYVVKMGNADSVTLP